MIARDGEGVAVTDVLRIDVKGQDLTMSESFKVTEALAVYGPGADAP